MIEAEGIKMAEDPEEAYWTKLKEEANKRIKEMQHEIIINEAIIKLAENKLVR